MSNINFNTPEFQRKVHMVVLEMAAWNDIPLTEPIRLVVDEYYNDRHVSTNTSFISVDEFKRHMERAMKQVDCKVSFEEECLAKVVRESKLYPKRYIAQYYDETKEISKILEDTDKIKKIKGQGD